VTAGATASEGGFSLALTAPAVMRHVPNLFSTPIADAEDVEDEVKKFERG